VTEDAAAKMERYHATIANVKQEIGVGFATAFLFAADAIEHTTDEIERGNRIIHAAADESRRLEAGMEATGRSGRGARVAIRDMGDAVEDVGQSAKATEEQLKAYQQALDHATGIQREARQSALDLVDGWHSQREVGEMLIGDLGRLNLSAQQLSAAEREIMVSLGIATEAQLENAAILEQGLTLLERYPAALGTVTEMYQTLGQGGDLAGFEEQLKSLETQRVMDIVGAKDVAGLAGPEDQFKSIANAATDMSSQVQQEFDTVSASVDDSAAAMIPLIEQIGNVKTALAGLSNVKISGFIGITGLGLAKGVRNFAGGLAVVGEEGPELVNLPKGSDVIPAGPTRAVLQSVGGPTPAAGDKGSTGMTGLGGTTIILNNPQFSLPNQNTMMSFMQQLRAAGGVTS
jgi:hypothetical protein